MQMQMHSGINGKNNMQKQQQKNSNFGLASENGKWIQHLKYL